MTNNGNSKRDRVTAERSDASSAVGGPSWIYPGFVPIDHLEVTVRVLYDRQSRAGRYQVEVSDPSTRELVAMRSRPIAKGLSARETQEEAYEWAYEAVRQLLDPDPFG